MNTSAENSPESFLGSIKSNSCQRIEYNFNDNQLSTIAFNLAKYYPWQNIYRNSHYFTSPFSNFSDIFLWSGIPKAKRIFEDLKQNTFKEKSAKETETDSNLANLQNEAINLKIISLPLTGVNNSDQHYFTDQDKIISGCQDSNNKTKDLVQSCRKRRKSGFQTGITVGYTYEAFFISDGRSKKRRLSDSITGISKYNFLKGKKESELIPALTVIEDVEGDSTKIQRFVCSECGKNYATSSNLSRHKQTHRTLDSQQARKCPHCEKIYVSMPALSMHILTHDLRYQCDICGKAFSRPWLLQGHRRAHTGEKPYGCAHCGRAFADRSNLRAHMQIHSSMKTYECGICKRNFALKSYLIKHLESSCCISS